MKLVQLLFVSLFFTYLTGCSGGSSSSGGFGPSGERQEFLKSCDGIITKEKLQAFNQSQSKFRIRSVGGQARCEAEINENGNSSRVEAVGSTHFAILPSLQLEAINKRKIGSYTIKTRIQKVTDEDIKWIVEGLRLPTKDQPASAYFLQTNIDSHLVRFGEGDLFYINELLYIKACPHHINNQLTKVSRDASVSNT